MTRLSVMNCLGAALIIGAGMVSAGCADKNAMSEESAQRGFARYDAVTGEMYRIYDYYPSHQVYRSEFQDAWFWNDGENWQKTTALPSHLDGALSGPVTIELPTAFPQHMHQTVAMEYPSNHELRETLAQLEQQQSSWDQAGWEAIANVPTEY